MSRVKQPGIITKKMRTLKEYNNEGFRLGKVNIPFINTSIYGTVDKAYKATKEQIKDTRFTPEQIAHRKGKAEAYRVYLDSKKEAAND